MAHIADLNETKKTLCPYGWGYFSNVSSTVSNNKRTEQDNPPPLQIIKEFNRGRWDAMLAGAAGFFFFCYFAPHFRGKLATMRVWHL